MRVAILSQYFEPEPLTRLTSLVRRLVAAGHTVEVLTALPNWPIGHYYDGYRPVLACEEQRHGARVVRTYVWPYQGRVTWKRFANYGSFMLSALWGAHRLDQLDVLYVYHPPLTISLPAYVIARLKQVPFIYDVQDIWPEAGVAAQALKPGLLYRSMTRWARWAYRHAARITVIAPDFVDVLVAQGAAREKISVVPNWADERIYAPRLAVGVRQRHGIPDDAFVAMYAGNLGSTHGVNYLLEAAQQLKQDTRLVFVFVGTGPEYEKMLRLKEQLGLANVRFLGYVQPKNMPELLAMADILLVHLRRSDSGAVSLPSRMLAYMASARPMLVASEGAPRRLVEEAQCGVTCEPENPGAIVALLQQLVSQPDLLHQMGMNGRQRYLNEFCEDIVLSRLIDLIEKVAEPEVLN
jgi:colanic acid biosynthesis glycosyl transferase WcaI